MCYEEEAADCGDGGDGGVVGCAAGEWECANGECINASYYCDGSSDNGNASWPADCSDGSDEVMGECCSAGLYDDACNQVENLLISCPECQDCLTACIMQGVYPDAILAVRLIQVG